MIKGDETDFDFCFLAEILGEETSPSDFCLLARIFSHSSNMASSSLDSRFLPLFAVLLPVPSIAVGAIVATLI
jgi:hypothetical protein